MTDEWQTLTVDDIKAPGDRSIAIGPFGSRMKADTYVAEGVPLIRGSNISDTRALVGDFVFVSNETADELRVSNVFADDLVFPHRGAIGKVAIVPPDVERYMLSTSLMKLTCDKRRVDPRFVFYFFRSELGRQALLQHASTVGTPGIGQPLTSLRSIRVPVPPLPEQRRIAHILGTLDDKIELNRRMNETLEEMARALFKSWFVDFDPVRAKAEGRDTGLPPHLADLFPDRLVDSELGEIPEGWRQGLLSELVVDLRDSVSPLLTPGEVFEHFSIPAFDDGRQPRIERGASIKSLKLRVSEGAILLSKLNPEIERVWMTDVQLAGRAICSTEFMVLQSPGGFGRAFAYAVMTSAVFRDGIKSRVTGTSGSHQRAGRDGVMQLPVVIPVRDLVASYEMLATPWLDEVSVNQREATALAAIRDAMLPRLLCDGRLAMDSICGPAEG